MESYNILYRIDGVLQDPQVIKRMIAQNLSKLQKIDNTVVDDKDKEKLKVAKQYDKRTGKGN